ncbi:MAG: ribonuclease R [Candidatus Kaiserbacteria bacterium]|nr:ribonuclease R [Candidatus Kaiserbacteria bacterium]MCB9816229.1 ribonuclease R [Candidatus Nomurabacteria bacterium]
MNKTHEGAIMIRGKGTGFVAHPDLEEDIVVEREALGFALDGDIVEIELKKKVPGKRQEGKVIRVVKPAHRELIGTVKEKEENGKKFLYLSPDNRRIHIRPVLNEATANDLDMKVVVEITKWSQPNLDPFAKIVEIIGRAGDHETEMQAIIRSGGFSKAFPESVQQAAHDLYERKEQIFADAIADPKRRDVRGVTTMTIDPADAKDFDDALSVRTLENGNIEVGIHIADVSHYVVEGEPLDQEAQERGTSVYLVDRVIPMLPEVLSNDLCSLRPNEDRLAFSAIFELTPEARIENAWYGQTIIHSDKRFAYEDAQKVLDDQAGDYLDELNIMMNLSRLLRKKRYQSGAIAFEQPEVKFELDERGAPIRAYKKERTETMMMIEDFMLLANREVATYINTKAKSQNRELAFVYRIHDVPNPDKIEELATFVHALGHEFETKKGIVKATEINKLMEAVEGTPEENLIKTASIRSMAKAVYSTKNIGHFGLAFKYYTHFTSPIRRYPDLMVHRMLRRHLDGSNIGEKETAKYERISVQSSEREMEAVSAERDSIKFKQVEYMMNHVGEEFDGVITGVTDWGIYVQETGAMAEGMVKLSSLKSDFYEHEANKYRVRGQRTGKVYHLGDPVRVKLVRADKDERQLDFEMIEEKSK